MKTSLRSLEDRGESAVSCMGARRWIDPWQFFLRERASRGESVCKKRLKNKGFLKNTCAAIVHPTR
jgi:hypothetical protein